MFFAGYLSIFRCGVEAGMSQMLLKQPQCIARVIQLHGMYAKGVPKSVGANASHHTSVWIHQIWQTRPSGTVSHYLPSPMSIKTKDKHRAAAGYLTLTEILLQNLQGVFINGQYSYPSMLLLPLHHLGDLFATPWAEVVSPTQTRLTVGAQ